MGLTSTHPARYLEDRGNAWWIEGGELMSAPKNSDGTICWIEQMEVDLYCIRGENYEPYVLAIYTALKLESPTQR